MDRPHRTRFGRFLTRVEVVWTAIAVVCCTIAYLTISLTLQARAVADLRRDGSIAAAETFYFVCADYRTSKLDEIERQHKNVDRDIKLLHLKDTPKLRRVIEREYRDNLKRYSLDRCAQLPSVRRAKAQYGVDVSRDG